MAEGVLFAPLPNNLFVFLLWLEFLVVNLFRHTPERTPDSGIFILIEVRQRDTPCRLQSTEASARKQNNAGFICDTEKQFCWRDILLHPGREIIAIEAANDIFQIEQRIIIDFILVGLWFQPKLAVKSAASR